MLHIALPFILAIAPIQMGGDSTATAPKQATTQEADVKLIFCPVTGEQIPSCCCPVKK